VPRDRSASRASCGDKPDAAEAKALSAPPRAGDIGRLHFNTKALGSSHHGDKKRHMPQSRSNIDKEVLFRKRGGRYQVKNMAHGRWLIEHHLR
jgi:hypothetical protein